MGRLDNKVAIITGAARGMGESHARRFIGEGARVVISDRLEKEGSALAEELGENALFVHSDVTDPASWSDLVNQAENHFGAVEILVNNAGTLKLHRMDEMTPDEFRLVLEVNTFGALHGMQAVLPSMRKNGKGSIINIASAASIQAEEGIFSYVASKWAVRGMTKAAALELATEGIRVNAVHPSEISTPMTDAMEKAGSGASPDSLPVKRFGVPDEVSSVVLFLASDEASFVTGSDYAVDGGYTA